MVEQIQLFKLFILVGHHNFYSVPMSLSALIFLNFEMSFLKKKINLLAQALTTAGECNEVIPSVV